ncbi:MAG TPA: alpha-amylase family glycosyl hydrolase [Desulfomonilia bacterium]|nr:alpha-amylase family glycosyl hydrolase [Desulfomonilia bacterium]
MNRVRGSVARPELSVRASDLNAMGLIDEVLHFMIEVYRRQVNRNVMKDAYDYASVKLPSVDETLAQFLDLFPPLDVHMGKITVSDYLDSETQGVSNKFIAMEEMLLLFVSNENPAFVPYKELFDDTPLRQETPYIQVISCLEEFFRTLPPLGPFGQTLLDLLLAPSRAAPNSLYDQLEYIRTYWGYLLAELYIKILGGLDLMKEESKVRFLGKGEALVPFFTLKDLEDLERFSADLDWMASLVLIAKSVYVWLHQLSVKYQRHIWRLDQIPDEEIEILARWGFSGLWLIGIWERSPASRTIKQMTGNPEAAASAYSIYDYSIAHELGGDEAFENLKGRAMRHGIRMATDMVPNHMGVYSKWVIEHPDWFLQLDHSPFPAYQFNGADLSGEDRVEIRIEDGYWDRRDAAVVFRRLDKYTGDTRYIYHGNDGTSMPWNDTAQLDFLKHEVRQAVINQTIAIARKFPIIRFDAAMTLAKRHFQRLWYPPPGYGGDIPSRAGHGVTPDEFERLFPVEFWRELVDRIAVEVPNTLLLAEAFWLMEGYFVRSLGMHRVYNSAFMNMLKTEDNSKYRDVMKNVLRFNPEILRRFVNFMNNPDEEPAVHGFGKDDKYFGVATLMATLPGLPMFGHGQIEGFSEKYGMEYRRSYWDEPIDHHLVMRHEREIFPLLKKRRLFSGVENFVLYDVRAPEGHVNEDIFAYSNILGDERSLVVYNNRYAEATGTISRSVGMNVENHGRRHIVHRSLGEGLALKNEDAIYYIFHDDKTDLEYIRNSRNLWRDGLMVHLGAFKCHVFTSFREIYDHDGRCRNLEERLMGAGVPDIMLALKELYLEKVLQPFGALVAPEALKMLAAEGRRTHRAPAVHRERLENFLKSAREFSGWAPRETKVVDESCSLIDALFSIDALRRKKAVKGGDGIRSVLTVLPDEMPENLWGWRMPVLFSVVSRLGELSGEKDSAARSFSLIEEWMLDRAMAKAIVGLGTDEGRAGYEVQLIKILVRHRLPKGALSLQHLRSRLRDMLVDTQVQDFLGFNQFDGKWWFNKESMEMLLSWLVLSSAVEHLSGRKITGKVSRDEALAAYEASVELGRMVEASGYEASRLASLLGA